VNTIEGDSTKTVAAFNLSDVVGSPNNVKIKIEHSDDVNNASAHNVGDVSDALFSEHVAHVVTPNVNMGKRSGKACYQIASGSFLMSESISKRQKMAQNHAPK
jgi:hypothetical protein